MTTLPWNATGLITVGTDEHANFTMVKSVHRGGVGTFTLTALTGRRAGSPRQATSSFHDPQNVLENYVRSSDQAYHVNKNG